MTRSFFRSAAAAALIAVAALATAPGARADMCHLTWDTPCCPVPDSDTGVAMGALTICNCTDTVNEYEWVLSPSAGSNLSFSPSSGTVTLDPGDCVDIPITIFCRPAEPGASRLFFAAVTNLTTGNQFECAGSVRDPGDAKVNPDDPTAGSNGVDDTDLGFTATNAGDAVFDQDIVFEVMPQGALRIEPAVRNLNLAPGETQSFSVVALPAVQRGAGADPVIADVIVKWDQDGDGDIEAGSSVAVRIERGGCPQDLDGDGRVGPSDLGSLLAAWGPCP